MQHASITLIVLSAQTLFNFNFVCFIKERVNTLTNNVTVLIKNKVYVLSQPIISPILSLGLALGTILETYPAPFFSSQPLRKTLFHANIHPIASHDGIRFPIVSHQCVCMRIISHLSKKDISFIHTPGIFA